MIYLRQMQLDEREPGSYPFNATPVASLGARRMAADVTFFAGENGTGKSTLLEALARKLKLPALGGSDAAADDTLAAIGPLAAALRLTWNRRQKRGFFLRAEDFFGFTRRIAALQDEMRGELRRVKAEYAHRDAFARGQAETAFAGSLYEMESLYGDDPDAQSHGESFLSVFAARMLPGGLYLLDEPEAALSPTSQMALMAMLHGLRDSCQFIIATHSPILLAFPGAEIWHFRQGEPIEAARWDALPGVRLTRDFLSRPERYLRHLLEEDGED